MAKQIVIVIRISWGHSLKSACCK